MRNLRRLPVLLRDMMIVNVLLILIALTLLVVALSGWVFAFPHMSSLTHHRLDIIGLNFVCLGMAMTNVVNRYTVRFRESDAAPYPLDTWRLQARALLWPSTLPVCAIVLALLISPERIVFNLVDVVTSAAFVVNFWKPAAVALQNIGAPRRPTPPANVRGDMTP